MHQETTAVLIHQLPLEMVQQPEKWSYAPAAMGNTQSGLWLPWHSICCVVDSSAGENVLVKVPGGRVTVGKPRDFPSYGWDSDYGQMEIESVLS